MSEAGKKSVSHWAVFAAALLLFLFVWLTAMFGMVLGDCRGPGGQGCFASKEVGLKILIWLGGAILVAAPFAEAQRRWWGGRLLFAGPFVLIAVVMAWPV